MFPNKANFPATESRDTSFPAEHMFAIVQFGLRPDASKHHIRVCACLAAQFAFFSRADSGVHSLVNATKNVASHLRKGVRILCFYDAL